MSDQRRRVRVRRVVERKEEGKRNTVVVTRIFFSNFEVVFLLCRYLMSKRMLPFVLKVKVLERKIIMNE